MSCFSLFRPRSIAGLEEEQPVMDRRGEDEGQKRKAEPECDGIVSRFSVDEENTAKFVQHS